MCGRKRTRHWVNSMLGSFSFRRHLLVWDSYEYHIENAIKFLLKSKKVDTSIIPGGCTKYIQAHGVICNKPFKQKVTDLYDEWLATHGLQRETAAVNHKAPPSKCALNEFWKPGSHFQNHLESVPCPCKTMGLPTRKYTVSIHHNRVILDMNCWNPNYLFYLSQMKPIHEYTEWRRRGSSCS